MVEQLRFNSSVWLFELLLAFLMSHPCLWAVDLVYINVFMHINFNIKSIVIPRYSSILPCAVVFGLSIPNLSCNLFYALYNFSHLECHLLLCIFLPLRQLQLCIFFPSRQLHMTSSWLGVKLQGILFLPW